MPANVSPSRTKCPNCGGCSNLQQVDVAEGDLHLDGPVSNTADGSTANHGPLQGPRFALASLGLFLVPALLAMIGASLGGSDQDGQILGAASGLFVGILGAMVVARVFRSESLELPKGEAP